MQDIMGEMPSQLRKQALDKDLKKISALETVGHEGRLRLLPLGFSLIFLVLVWLLATNQVLPGSGAGLVIAAAVIGGYMALNIGANDVANNMAPAVGARALTMTGALVVAAIFEAAGALIAGADVVETISRGIINPAAVSGNATFVALMMAALLGAALWLNLATWIGAPVSTTHSIVGGVLGAGITAAGFDVANWPVMGAIAASWVISPLLGGLIAAGFLAILNALILQADDRIAAARRWVPLIVGGTASAFTVYLVQKGLSKVWHPGTGTLVLLSVAILLAGAQFARMAIARRAPFLDNSEKAVGTLFTVPLIVAAALLSFAHGANDVANAIGPLAAIAAAVGGESGTKVTVPSWIMLIGAIGISVGLALFGPRLIRVVGEKITKLNPVRAFCVALSAAITVLVASALGLPVSSTHIAVGAVFGVGLAREYHVSRGGHIRRALRLRGGDGPAPAAPSEPVVYPVPEETLRKVAKRRLVRRSHLLTIVAAWVITVPLTALISAALFLAIRSFVAGI
ncbi:inorganic phosphate transporter [Rhodospirillum centenum]|uniref:Phosphate transporter n=1 Tax=Rhodospirillum centenum (strain ATCC 51521 / SW) TaxID=414684 RepID=B6IQB2_RHOCS|nr:inorganic phosphate transporter [Rhodospirillum centenum]ACI97648.1 phosphate transporter family protein [Rhodospirillum centenum SW]